MRGGEGRGVDTEEQGGVGGWRAGADGVAERAGGVERAGREGWSRLVVGHGGGGRRDRAGLRCSGGSYRVVCYLSTSDQSHLLQGEGEEAGGGREQTFGNITVEKMEGKEKVLM